ncbi:MAG TPA: hypothetical protein VF007_05860 [Stellaceae bacterium]
MRATALTLAGALASAAPSRLEELGRAGRLPMVPRLLAMFLCLATGLILAGNAHAACKDPLPSAPKFYPLYKDAVLAMRGRPEERWLEPADAYSAETVTFPFDSMKVGGAKFKCVIVRLVMQAESRGATVGVGLFAMPSVTTNAADVSLDQRAVWFSYAAMSDEVIAPYGMKCYGNGPGPHPCKLDVTDAFNAFLYGGQAPTGNMDATGAPAFAYVSGGQPLAFAVGAFGNGANGPSIYEVSLYIFE